MIIHAYLNNYTLVAIDPEYKMNISEEELEEFKKMSPDEKEEYLQEYADLDYSYTENSDIGKIISIEVEDNKNSFELPLDEVEE